MPPWWVGDATLRGLKVPWSQCTTFSPSSLVMPYLKWDRHKTWEVRNRQRYDTWGIHFMKINLWRNSKLFHSPSVLSTTELCTTDGGSVQHKPSRTDPRYSSRLPKAGPCSTLWILQKAAALSFHSISMAHATFNSGKKGYRAAHPHWKHANTYFTIALLNSRISSSQFHPTST